MDKINTELLISLVEARHVLWDKTLDIYKDKNLKLSAWREICCVLSENFEEMEQKERESFDYVMCTENGPFMRDGIEEQLLYSPYMVAVNRYNFTSQQMRFLCVGVIVDDSYILTVATCVNKPSDGNKLLIYTGDPVRNTLTYMRVVAMIFDPHTVGINKNIALLKLVAPLTRTATIRPITFPTVEEVRAGLTIEVKDYTFFYTSQGKYTKSLWRQLLNTINSKNVQDLPTDSFAALTNDTSGTNLNADDIGSPAFINGTFVGVVSWVSTQPYGIVIFTDVLSCWSFIANIIWNQ